MAFTPLVESPLRRSGIQANITTPTTTFVRLFVFVLNVTSILLIYLHFGNYLE